MTNLPVNLPPVKAFEGASKTIRLDMYEGFVVPGQMVFEVYYNRVKQYDLTPSYNPSNRQLTATFTAEQVKAFPLIADVRIRFDSSYPFRLQIKPTTEGTDDGVVGYTIQQAGDSYTVIEIYAKDEIDAQVEVATQKANDASVSAAQSSEWAQVAQDFSSSAGSAANVASNKATESANSATSAVNAQTAAEAAQLAAENARDQVVGIEAHKADFWVLNTKADADSFAATLPGWAFIGVLADETNGGDKAIYLHKTTGNLEEFLTL